MASYTRTTTTRRAYVYECAYVYVYASVHVLSSMWPHTHAHRHQQATEQDLPEPLEASAGDAVVLGPRGRRLRHYFETGMARGDSILTLTPTLNPTLTQTLAALFRGRRGAIPSQIVGIVDPDTNTNPSPNTRPKLKH